MHHFSHRPCALAASLLTLAGVLAGCGGGSSQGSDTASAPAAPHAALIFTAPTEDDNVHNVNTPVPLRLSVTVAGAAPPDGMAITLGSSGNASLVPVQPLTQGGMLTSTLSTAQAGTLELFAAPATAPQQPGARRTLYFRPQPQRLEVLVPAYFSPGAHWNRLARSLQSFPSVPVTAILNPSNGIFSTEDPLLTAAISAFRQSGGNVLGYVYTRYGKGSRTVADVQRNIDAYRRIYGAHVDGFFLDEMDATGKQLGFYREVYQYIKRMDSRLRVVGNPGSYPVADFAGVADALVTFEGQAIAYQGRTPQPSNTWVYQRSNGAQAALVHDATSCSAMQEVLRSANTPLRNTGLVYATDLHYDYPTNTGNPWAALPSYWEQMLGTVDAINNGLALPAC